MLDAFSEGGSFFIVGAVATVLSVLLIGAMAIVALGRKGRGVWLDGVVIAAIVLPFICFVVSMRAGAMGVRAAVTAADPAQKATQLAQGVSKQLYAGAGLGLALTLCVGLGAIAIALACSKRLEAGRAGAVVSVLASGGLVALLGVATLKVCASTTSVFSAIAVADPSQKSRLLEAGLGEISVVLETAWIVFGVGLALVWVISIATQLRASWEPKAGGMALAAGLVVGGCGLIAEALPFAQENYAPRITQQGGGRLLSSPLTGIEGPDEVPRFLQVSIHDDPRAPLKLEGFAMGNAAALEAKIGEMKKIEQVMHPSKPATTVLLTGEPETRSAHVELAVTALRDAGYTDVLFGFRADLPPHERPYFGRLPRSKESAAKASLQSGEATVTVDTQTFREIAVEVNAHRKANKTVWLRLAEAEFDSQD